MLLTISCADLQLREFVLQFYSVCDSLQACWPRPALHPGPCAACPGVAAVAGAPLPLPLAPPPPLLPPRPAPPVGLGAPGPRRAARPAAPGGAGLPAGGAVGLAGRLDAARRLHPRRHRRLGRLPPGGGAALPGAPAPAPHPSPRPSPRHRAGGAGQGRQSCRARWRLYSATAQGNHPPHLTSPEINSTVRRTRGIPRTRLCGRRR